MLTRQGWALLMGAITLLTIGRLFGIRELYVFSAVAVLLVGAALIYVHLLRIDLQVERRVHPSRVHAGSTSRVDIQVRNLRSGSVPPLTLHDKVSGTMGAELLMPSLEPGDTATASYRLPTGRRGIVTVGPLTILVTDPFGLVQTKLQAASPVDVTVFPRVDEIPPVPFTLGHDPLGGSVQPNSLSNAGDDFYALRPYVMGDDLRRIHWPSTARHDELLVCQHEQPWQGRTTVLLDVNTDAHTPQGLELAISAAASIVTANGKRRDLIRLVTTDGGDSGFGMGNAHLQNILERLALINSTNKASVASTAEVLQRDKGSGGALVAVVGALSSERLAALTRLGRRAGSFTLVNVDLAGGSAQQPLASAVARGGGRVTPSTVIVNEQSPFAETWRRTIGTPRRSRLPVVPDPQPSGYAGRGR